jgi:N-acetylmuramoyl-L-alanine amidase
MPRTARILSRLCLLGAVVAAVTAGPHPAAAPVRLHGSPHYSLARIAGAYDMAVRPADEGRQWRLKNGWADLLFTKDRRDFTLNGLRLHLGNPVATSGGALHISQRDFRHTLLPLLNPRAFAPLPALRHIVLDAGHGGRDSGARNPALGLSEKSLALDIARRLATLLREQGHQVSFTRNDDRFIELEDRPAIANRRQADLFVSIHFNAFSSASVAGVETFAYTNAWQPSTGRARLHSSDKRAYPANRHDPWNLLAAYYVQSALVATTGAEDRGVKRARFTVLQSLQCPGVLVELGFITNPYEGRRIASGAYRDLLARSLARGILTYGATLERLQRR